MNVTSPMMLATRPKRGKGVRRLNRMPVYLGAGALFLITGVVAYTYHQRMNRQQQQAAEAETSEVQGAASHAQDFFSKQVATQPINRQQPTATTPATPAIETRYASAPAVDPADPRKRAWDQYYARLAALEQAKADAAGKAMDADTELSGSGGPSAVNGTTSGYVTGQAPQGNTAAAAIPNAGLDAGAQAEKRAFLAQGGDPLGANEDLLASLHGPKLDTIMEGTAIPGTMVGGLTSDMPGMVVGEIKENIYDSATGNDLLIPQGSRIVGTYDNSVSGGQERIGVIWNRIIFPDTSSIQLGSMEGADQGGYAGFKDLVDTHFWDKFLSATIISIAGAAAQLSQPQQSTFSGYSPTSVGAGAMTQGYSNLGQKYAEAGLAIPNTLEIRPGYSFVIMCAKDVRLPPYIDRRNASARQASGPIVQ
jgi:type IV secretion system protein TrbI